MNKQVFHFVGLDLETTGLNTKNDTIIEIAMVAFSIEKDEHGLHTILGESRSYLINPGRKIEENISLITGINDDMVLDAPFFNSIKEEIQDFIGDNIIVGHNVLFDITMLETHGIKTRNDIICDTFEFSEILFQDCESLNLSFLASQFGFNNGGEHRALDDTIMSVQLFIHILGELRKISQEKKDLFIQLGENFQFETFLFIVSLLKLEKKNSDLIGYQNSENISNTITHTNQNKIQIPLREQKFLSLGMSQENEDSLFKELNIQNKKVLLVVRKRNTLDYFKIKFGEHSFIYHNDENYLDLERFLFDCNKSNNKIISRKQVVLICKVLFWLQTTKTGNLEELRFYGDEYLYMRKYRSIQGEQSYFQRKKWKDIEQAQYILATHKDYLYNKRALEDTGSLIYIRDLFEFENSLTENESAHIYFSVFHELSELIAGLEIDGGLIEQYILSISIIEQIIIGTATKKGDTSGEINEQEDTYFIEQKELWGKGMWGLKKSYMLFKSTYYNLITNILTPEIKWEYTFMLKEIEKNIEILERVICIYQENISFIVNIYGEKVSLHLIPQRLDNPLEKLGNHIFYDFDISNPLQETFLKRQLGIQSITKYHHNRDDQNIIYINTKSLPSKFPKEGKILILTTNMKDSQRFLRELTTRFPEDGVFCQGISGGKSKIISLIKKSEKSRTFIIGTCDYWGSDYSLLKQIDLLIITKIPFYPPNDAGFLVKTHGMKNSFRDYSLPLAIQGIKIIIRNYILYSGKTHIYITDDRIILSEWGEIARNEIIKQ